MDDDNEEPSSSDDSSDASSDLLDSSWTEPSTDEDAPRTRELRRRSERRLAKQKRRTTHWTHKPLGKRKPGLRSYRPTMREFRRVCSYRLYKEAAREACSNQEDGDLI